MDVSLRALKNFKVHALAILLTVGSEMLGTQVFKLDIGSIAFFPMLYALIIGLIIGLPRFGILSIDDEVDAAFLINISMLLLLARYGTLVGPNFFVIIKSGLALVLQEFGNLGTAVLAIPLAVMIGLKREAVGGGHSLSREPNVALISEMYGIDSPEGRGVMGVYICGTMFGSIFFGVITSIVASWGIFSMESLAMAAGTGSASMMTATVGALQSIYPPEKKEIIAAFAAASNMLSGLDGLYMSLLIGLPLSNWLYKKCYKLRYGVDPEPEKRLEE